MKSGISDFSEELVPALKNQNIDVVIFSPEKVSSKNILNDFEVHTLSKLNDKKIRESLDLIVYQIGNNYTYHGQIVEMLMKYPGVVELHEIGLHHLVAESVLDRKGIDAYLDYVEYCHGKKGTEIAKKFFKYGGQAPWEQYPLELNMARKIIESASGLIVHSEMSKQMALGICNTKPIVKIPHHSAEFLEDRKNETAAARKKSGISDDILVLGSFGFATPTKRIIQIIDACSKYKKEVTDKFLYYIVGEVSPSMNLERKIAECGLSENVRITGFVTLDEFKNYIKLCDICINLRYPTQGESSGSIHRMLGMGKPIITTDIGTFSEFPDSVALKVRYDDNETDDIFKAICTMSKNKKTLEKYSQNAFDYAKENFEINRNAEKYLGFFKSMIDGTWQPDYQDVVIGRLCELKLTDENYLKHLPYFELQMF